MHRWEVGLGEPGGCSSSSTVLPGLVGRAVEEGAGGMHRDVGCGGRTATRFCKEKLHELCSCVLAPLLKSRALGAQVTSKSSGGLYAGLVQWVEERMDRSSRLRTAKHLTMLHFSVLIPVMVEWILGASPLFGKGRNLSF